MPQADYPDWICYECGMKYGRSEPRKSTWHIGRCDICGETKSVTQPRDFGHLVGMELMTGRKRANE